MIIAVDFDGTCVTHDYPNVGKDVGAVPVLKRIVDAGHDIMLWTMRSDAPIALKENLVDSENPTNTLQDAVNWFKENDIPLFSINENPEQIRTQWSTSNKQYAHLYIDDAALGCPLTSDVSLSSRPFVDWKKVNEMLKFD